VARPTVHTPKDWANSKPIWVIPLRETTKGTPNCAAFNTISLVSRPVV
jgi:hypothetical protein